MRGGGFRFTDHSWVQEEILKSPELERMLLDKARQIESNARSIAPSDTGAYRDSIASFVEDAGERSIARVKADVPHALKVEAIHGTLDSATQMSR